MKHLKTYESFKDAFKKHWKNILFPVAKNVEDIHQAETEEDTFARNRSLMDNNEYKVEVYDCEDGSISVVAEDDKNKEIIIGKNPKLLRKITGKDWEDCMRQHHELMGWEPYKPF